MAAYHGRVLFGEFSFESIILEVAWGLSVTVYMLWIQSYYAVNLKTFCRWVSYRKADKMHFYDPACSVTVYSNTSCSAK